MSPIFVAIPGIAARIFHERSKAPAEIWPRTLLSVGLISVLVATGATGWFLDELRR